MNLRLVLTAIVAVVVVTLLGNNLKSSPVKEIASVVGVLLVLSLIPCGCGCGKVENFSGGECSACTGV